MKMGSLDYLEQRVLMYEQYREMSDRSTPTPRGKWFAQKLELMTYRDDFQDEVRFFRKCFGIPTDGFTDFSSCRKWAKGVSSDPKAYAKKDFLRAYAKLLEHKVASEFGEYEAALRAFMRLLHIRRRWLEAVEYYALFNRIDSHQLLPKSVATSLGTTDAITGESVLHLEIGTETELSDITEWWSTIENYQGFIRSQGRRDVMDADYAKAVLSVDPVPHVVKQKRGKERKHLPHSLEKMRKAYELKRAGKNYKEIAEKIKCGQGEVGTYVKRFRDAVTSAELD